MAKGNHGVSSKKAPKGPKKTQKRLAIKRAAFNARTSKGTA